jgi:hypothetical protein
MPLLPVHSNDAQVIWGEHVVSAEGLCGSDQVGWGHNRWSWSPDPSSALEPIVVAPNPWSWGKSCSKLGHVDPHVP